jgi:hypothetical protein
MQISPTQSNAQAALRSFLLAVLPPFGSDGNPVEVIAAVQNRVPEPLGTSFALMTVVRFERLETNQDSYQDVKFTGSITPATASFTGSIAPATAPGPAVMTVTAMGSGSVVVGGALSGATLAAGTTVQAQLSGTPGGIGTYAVTPIQTAPSTSISETYGLMTVTAVAFGTILTGAAVFGTGVAAGTSITALGSGTGGDGTYVVSPSQTFASGTMSAGAKTIQQNAHITIQCDFHSADTTASDMAQTVSSALRDEYGVDFFAGLAPPLNGVVPLYADDPRYVPWINESQQMEARWILDVHLQANQITVVPQQFSDAVALDVVSVEADFPAA